MEFDIDQIDVQKQIILRNEFTQINIPHNKFISLQDIQFALDQKNQGVIFDRSVLQQLLDQMAQTENLSTIDEFIKVFLHAEKILIQNIIMSKEYLQNCYRSIDETKTKIRVAASKEKVNGRGISEDSTFSFTISSASFTNRFARPNFQSYIEIECGSALQYQRTPPEPGIAPTFEYSNNFQITSGDEQIIFRAVDAQPSFTSQSSGMRILGAAEINVAQLKNQQIFDSELMLFNENNESIGTLKVQVRWVHSQVSFLKEELAQWEAYLEEQTQDLQDYQRDLSTLYEPFKQLQQYTQNMQNMHNNPNSYPNDQSSPQRNYQDYNQNKSTSAIFQTNHMQLNEGGRNSQGYMNANDSVDYKRILMFGNFCYLALAILISFNRTMFFDFLIIFKLYDCHLKEQFTGQIYKQFTVAILLTFLAFDFCWIVNFTTGWFGISQPDSIMRYFVDLLSLILFLFKLFLMVINLMLWSQYEQSQTQISQTVATANPNKDTSNEPETHAALNQYTGAISPSNNQQTYNQNTNRQNPSKLGNNFNIPNYLEVTRHY